MSSTPTDHATRSVRVALVGLGRQGIEHYRALQKLDQKGLVKIRAVVEVKPRGQVEADLKVAGLRLSHPLFSRLEEAFAQTAVNTVVIAVPNYLHFELCQIAFNHGCDVVKEKPLATSFNQGQELVKLAQRNHCLLITTQQRRVMSSWQQARHLLPTLGKVTEFRYHFTLNDTIKSWYWDLKQAGGGVWLNLGWHGLAVVKWLLGPIANVQARLLSGNKRPWAYDTEHTAYARLLLNSGAKGSLFLSCIYPKQERLLINGTQGLMVVDREKIQMTRRSHRPQTLTFSPNSHDIYELLHLEIIQQLRTQTDTSDQDLALLHSIQQGKDTFHEVT